MADSAPRLLLLASSPFPAPTGIATRLAQRIVAFSQAGYALDVLTPKTPELPYVSRLLDARLLRVPTPSPNGRAATARDRLEALDRTVRRQLLGNEYDAIHAFDPFPALAALEAAPDTPLVYEAAAPAPSDADDALVAEWRHRERRALQQARLVVTPSQAHAEAVRRHAALPERVHVVRPAADVGLFRPGDVRRFSESPARLVVLAGTLGPAESQTLRDVARHLKPAVPLVIDVFAAIPASERDRLTRASTRQVRIACHEPVLYDDLPPRLEGASLGLLIGSDEALPLQPLPELFACGLCVLAPDRAAVRELAGSRDAAWLLDTTDATDVARAIEHLLANRDRARAMGIAARSRAEAAMDAERAARTLLALYGTLLSPSVHVAPDVYAADADPLSLGESTLPDIAIDARSALARDASVTATEPATATSSERTL